MDELGLIPQQIYEQKFKLSPNRLDKIDEKRDLVPINLGTVYKKVNAKTMSSRKNH